MITDRTKKDRDDSFVVAAKIAGLFKADPLVRDVRAAADQILEFATIRDDTKYLDKAEQIRNETWDALIEAAAQVVTKYLKDQAGVAGEGNARRHAAQALRDRIRALKRSKT